MCVKSMSFSILINGNPTEAFSPELLPQRSHKADDNIIFARSDKAPETIKDILATFKMASGQRVNLEKNEITFGKGTKQNVKAKIAQILGISQREGCQKYLGLPTRVERSKKVIFEGVKGNLEKKLKGWGNMFLSKAGRAVLIKVVAQSIPTYAIMEEMRVSLLIEPSLRSWKYELIDQIFIPFEVIKPIPLSCSTQEDRRIWHCDKFGEYSVKSAYHLICKEGEQEDIPNSSNPNLSIWSYIWAANVTPYIKIHAWSICNGGLPINLRLASRISEHQSLCSYCDEEDESEMHILRDYEFSRVVWNRLEVEMD
ncbi:LOW QUALITY PROTEIN: hypothetical protein V2J09_006811 [Rumex salicifolius]